MADRGDRRAALLSGGDAQGPARRGQARPTKPRGRGDGRGGRSGLAYGERLKRPAAAECAGGDPRAPLAPLARGLRAVAGWGGVGAGLWLRGGGGGGGPGGGR